MSRPAAWCLLALLALMMVTLQNRLRTFNDLYPDGPYTTLRIARHRSVPPFQRRILMPTLAVAVQEATHAELSVVELLLRFICLSVTLALYLVLLSHFTAPESALAGCLLLLALLPLGFYMNPSIDSYAAMGILAGGLALIHDRKAAALIPLITLGATIRESSVLLLPLSVLAWRAELPPRRWLPAIGGQALAWGAAFGFLAWRFPGDPIWPSLGDNLRHVFGEGVPAALLRVPTVYGPLMLALLGLQRLSGLPRAMVLVGLAYSLGLQVVARMNEPRVLYEAYLLIVPGILAAVGVWKQPAAERVPADH